MKLIIMRHAEAGQHRLDALRTLTDRGRTDSRSVARSLAESAWYPRTVWCSPLVRARQTADIIASSLDLDVQEKPFLTPDDLPETVTDALQGFSAETPLLLVSHMPLVGALAGLLLESRASSLPMATSQAICLEMDIAAAGCAEFRAQFLAESRD